MSPHTHTSVYRLPVPRSTSVPGRSRDRLPTCMQPTAERHVQGSDRLLQLPPYAPAPHTSSFAAAVHSSGSAGGLVGLVEVGRRRAASSVWWMHSGVWGGWGCGTPLGGATRRDDSLFIIRPPAAKRWGRLTERERSNRGGPEQSGPPASVTRRRSKASARAQSTTHTPRQTSSYV